MLADEGDLLPGEIRGNRVGTGDGVLELVVVQPEGRPVMNGADWARGVRPGPDGRVGG